MYLFQFTAIVRFCLCTYKFFELDINYNIIMFMAIWVYYNILSKNIIYHY